MNTKERTLSQSLWDYLCSLKLAMTLLLTLAITSIIGTVIPQGGVSPAYIESISQAKMKLYQALGFFDMYHSWWFILLLGALSANLFACSIKRLPQIWKLVTQPVTTLDEGLRKTLPNLASINSPEPARALKERMVRILGASFSTPLVTETDGAYHLFAEKAPWCRLAVYAVHLSILVIFVGAITGSLFGFKGFVNIPEGESVTQIAGRDGKSIDLGFAVRCDKFSVSFYDTGAPREFKSLLTVLENGKPVQGYQQIPVIVNAPLSYQGITFYQSSYGKAGQHNFTVSGPDGSHPVAVSVPSGGSARLPDGGGMHVLEATPDVAPFEPGRSGPAANIEIHKKGGQTVRMVVYANYPELNLQSAKKSGAPLFSYAGGKESVYTGLQVARDPGVWIVWLGCLLMVVGVYCAFFLSHRRVWVLVKDGEVVIGGNANKNPAGFELYFDRLVQKIKDELSPGEKR
ncbi:MAG TPA: cytochrome c biogenesis protein ResB [Geomonas sp.]